jgi:DNA-binding GntR family transcriptional regulator
MLGLETTIRVSTRVLYPKFSARKDRLIAAAHEHRMLCDAIKARDPVSAEQLAQSHVRNVINFWIDDTNDGSST